MVHGVGSNNMSLGRKFSKMLPSHRSLAGSHDDILIEILYVFLIPFYIVGVYEDDRIDMKFF